jgi:hypothetical protein
MVHEMPSIEHVEKLCAECLVGKQRRVSFPHEVVYMANKVLELVHGDLIVWPNYTGNPKG